MDQIEQSKARSDKQDKVIGNIYAPNMLTRLAAPQVQMPLARLVPLFCCRRASHIEGRLEPTESESSEGEEAENQPETEQDPLTEEEPPAEPDPLSDPRTALVVQRGATRLLGRVGRTPAEAGVTSPGLVRWYSVWYIPDRHYTEVAGVHWGVETTAYSAIIELNKGHFGGIRWRRYDSLEAAQRGFRAECTNHGLSPYLSEKLISWEVQNDPAT